ncbi:hypothetical protein DFH28DRAFT_1066608 [Melampsora americana]|nr:hypothetical protein DFH28DRAFT_1066608 [Melampsora americana]
MRYLALSSYLLSTLVVITAHNISSDGDATPHTPPADNANYTSLPAEGDTWLTGDTTTQTTLPGDASNDTSLVSAVQNACVAANNHTAVEGASYGITNENTSVQDNSYNTSCDTTANSTSFSDWAATNFTTNVEVNQTLTHQVTNHTLCYNYFLQKDGCVHSSTDSPCGENATSGHTANYIGTFETQPLRRRLRRRYDTTNGSLSINGGDGICGPYNTETTSGVCLWSGSEWVSGSDPQTAGWLNGAATGNCGKQVYIQRHGQPETVQFAPVLDGCNFWTTQPEVGCFQIWMTKDLFDKFSPTEEESQNLLISSTFTWDFDNLHGNSTENAPL